MRLPVALLLCVRVMISCAGARYHLFHEDVQDELDFYKKRVITINGEIPGVIIPPATARDLAATEARFHPFNWDVKDKLDFSKKLVITINGETPGPTIQGQKGDTVEVKVTNSLMKDNVAIHWAEIRQIGSPWCDGTKRVSPCPILPGQTFTYRFILDRLGTSSYYSYYSMQVVAGLHGRIEVWPPDGVAEPFNYDYEQSVILNDWFDKSTHDQAFYWDGKPEFLKIQRKGKFGGSKSAAPSLDTTDHNTTNHAYLNWTVVPGKAYRLRILSVAILYPLSFQIEGHNLTVVEADGQYGEPIVRQKLFIYPLKTYSVLIKADQDPSRNYWITSNIVGPNTTATTAPGLSVLNYYPDHPKRVPPTDPLTGPHR